jgi:hypothetical protein
VTGARAEQEAAATTTFKKKLVEVNPNHLSVIV